jgi:hypothetical protein
MKRQIEIAAKMYRCHDTIKRYYGAEFEEKIQPYKNVITGYMQEHSCNEVEAVLQLCKDSVISQHGWTVMALMAATVEIAEPSDMLNKD